jgi:hypothetical protein
MTECEELAQALLPKYYQWNSTLEYVRQGHSSVKIKNWVMQRLRATESYVVIDNVTQAIDKLVFDQVKKERNAHLQTPNHN